MRRPALLFYCQHSLGLGHLVRSFALAGALAERFRVVLLNGGRLPRALPLPPGVEVVSLPPLGMTVAGELVSHDRRRSARSLRDILVGSRANQQKFDERASRTANALYDAILVHADPRFARLEESFRPATPLSVPVHYTGFVLPGGERTRSLAPTPVPPSRPRVVVSAGGGAYGGALLRAAVEAHRLKLGAAGVDLRLIAGPFLPEAEWRALREAARGRRGLQVRRSVPDLGAEFESAAGSVSQCGYNTTLDLLRTGVPALVVPFAEGGEDEQTRRAERLARLGALRVLDAARAAGPTLAAEIVALLRFRPAPVDLDFDGAGKTALVVANLLACAKAPAPGARRALVGVAP